MTASCPKQKFVAHHESLSRQRVGLKFIPVDHLIVSSIVQGWESIKELVLASVPTAAKLATRFFLQAKMQPKIMTKLYHQVRSGGALRFYQDSNISDQLCSAKCL